MLPARTLCSGCTGHSGPLTSFLSLHYITLHYITLHYIILHYITLHYITLHYITLHYIILYYIGIILDLPVSRSFISPSQG